MDKSELEALVESLYTTINVLTLEIKELQVKLREYERDTRHQIELREDGFTIMHPLACRPNLFDCEFNDAARAEGEDLAWHLNPGRYYCSLVGEANLIIEERVPDA